MNSVPKLSLAYLFCSVAAETSSYINGQKSSSIQSALFEPTVSVPPVAKKVQHFNLYHGNQYLDEYNWLRDDNRNNSDVLSHLKKENIYSSEMLEPLQPLADYIYKSISSRVAEDDFSYPTTIGDYQYYTKSVKGLQHIILVRKRISKGGAKCNDKKDEILLDLNKFKEKYMKLGALKISPNQKFLAYTLDTKGSENYNVFVKNLETGETTTEVKACNSYIFWSSDNNNIFYTTKDNIRRTNRVFRRKFGCNKSTDELLYEEKDLNFVVGLEQSVSKKYLFMPVLKRTANEYHYLDLEKVNDNFTCFSPRMEDRIYYLEHKEKDFLIRTNHYMGKKYINNYVLKAPIDQKLGQRDEQSWKEVVQYNELHYIKSVYGLKNHIILGERFEGCSQIKIIDDSSSTTKQSKEGHLIKFPEPIFVASISSNHFNYDKPEIIYSYSSLLTPETYYKYNITDQTSKVIKKSRVFSGFDSNLYKTERLVADNNVPISIVYRRDKLKLNGSNPLHLFGYGSYGFESEPSFKPEIFPLLDCGFVYAIAHVRGGTEMGRQWYETEGKLLEKKNTFRDFEAVAKHLIKMKYTSSNVLSIEGGSAGGLLVGATINRNPNLFNAAIADVPFLDVINTMMDPSIPSTIGEYEEWGDPNNKKVFDYMLSYSPYDNLPSTMTKFPHMLVRSGLNDYQVPYWESAKYVAKLRDILCRTKSENRTKVLQIIDMNSGHSGVSGRYNQYKRTAQNYAFLISTAKKVSPFNNK